MGKPHDSFDPTMFLSRTDDTVAGEYAAPERSGKDNGKPSVLRYAGDGTAQLRSAANTKHNSTVPSGGDQRSVYPDRVDEFDPINLRPGPQNVHISGKGKGPEAAGG